MDDSVRVFSNEFPATGALHPLARTAPGFYRYALTGDLTVTPASGPALRLLRVQVTPRRAGPALIAGQLWIDSSSAEVVRLTFRYVGTGLWVRAEDGPRGPDSAKARRLNALANRVVSIDADLEYGLQEGRFWMPHRQVLAGRVRVPLVKDLVIPFQATTTFDAYEINSGRPIVFDLPLPETAGLSPDSLRALRRVRMDSLQAERRGRTDDEADSLRSWDYADRWPGGRYELHRPSNVELQRYDTWPDSLRHGRRPRPTRVGCVKRRPSSHAWPRRCPTRSRGRAGEVSPTSGCPTCCGTTGCRVCRSASGIASGRRSSPSPTCMRPLATA